MKINQVDEKWSEKYKRSIDCSNPKGFSQRAHCDGRKKKESLEEDGKGRTTRMPAMTVQPYMTGLSDPDGDYDDGELRVYTQAYRDMYKQAKADQVKADQRSGKGTSYISKPRDVTWSSNVAPKRTTPKKPRVAEELYDFDKDEPMKSTVAVPGYGTMSIDGLMKNLIQSVTELLGKMKQGNSGMRAANYEINRNKVLNAKFAALVQALDDLQAIRAKGGARSRNIQQEAEQQPLPVDVNKIFDNIQEFESRQYITPQDADKMRRGVQSLTSGRQTINSEAILQLLTMVTR